jgi:cell division protein FtsB
MRYLNLALLVLLALLQHRLWTGPGSIPDVQRLMEIRDTQAEENRDLKERNRVLAAEVLDLKHGLDAVEERARSEMGMIRSDETFYQIIPPPPATAADG